MPATDAPTHIGDYVLDAELGRGAFGTVYRAHHVDRPEEPVALKVVEGRGDHDRALLEPALLAQLDHPCVVGINDYFRAGDRLVLALEYVEGEDLKSMLDRGETFSQAVVHDFLVQMAGALAAAHGRQIVHRDIKPSNVLVVREAGRLRFVLTDFGIGKQVEGIQDRKHTGGTYLFMAPEQLRGRPGPQSDLWALGVVAYRLLTGRLPFPGPSLPELVRQIQYATPAPPSQVCPEPVDPQLEAAVMRLLDKSLQERVASAEELLRLLGFEGAATEVLSRTTTVERGRRPRGDSLDRQLERSIRWRKVLLVVLLAAYLLPNGLVATTLLVAGLWLFFRGQTVEGRTWRYRAGVLVGSLALLSGYRVVPAVAPEIEPIALAIGNRSANGKSARAAIDDSGLVEYLVVAAAVATAGFNIAGPVVAASIYVGLRRRQREKTLRDAALQSGAGSEEYLELLRTSLAFRFADVGFHLKYAEALVARGRHADAAVEARLILEQDPYNFSGNLLLANAYYTLGLRGDCARVCDTYLEVSGYCFEFAELRDQCRATAGGP